MSEQIPEKELNQETMDKTEERVIMRLTNEASQPFDYGNYKFVFKRPAFTEKFKGRAWATRQLKATGFSDDVGNEDPDIFAYFRIFGTLNIYVYKIYSKVNGKFVEFKFDPLLDIEHQFLFEKFMVEEIYNTGTNEEDNIVFELSQIYTQWLTSSALEEKEDIKNS